ncbi:MAG: SDR family oxidoreductase [Erysipelotrichaceae bacterium]|nr:SDR family oxidoreductase [Erysipelotrichaceae bacterium]
MSDISEKRVVVITGSGGGIGCATAYRFSKAGYEVVLLDMDLEAAEKTASKIGVGDDHCFQTDVSSQNSIRETIESVLLKFGQIDALVNAAGIPGKSARFENYPVEVAEKVLCVNIMGTLMMMQAVLPSMQKRGEGSIVNFGSVSGHRGYPYESAYGASKAAVIELTKTAANENGCNGVRINSVSPGWVDTNMMKQTINGYKDVGCECTYDNVRLGPMKRPADPREIADVVFFLCSKEASYINGSDIVIDGGKITE